MPDACGVDKATAQRAQRTRSATQQSDRRTRQAAARSAGASGATASGCALSQSRAARCAWPISRVEHLGGDFPAQPDRLGIALHRGEIEPLVRA